MTTAPWPACSTWSASPRSTGSTIVTIADLIQYRLQTERLVRRLTDRKARGLDLTGTEWTWPPSTRSSASPGSSSALAKGNVATTDPVLCRVHSGSLVGDLFSSTPVDGGSNLREAILAIEKAGYGHRRLHPAQAGDLARELELAWAPPVHDARRHPRGASNGRSASSASGRRSWPTSVCTRSGCSPTASSRSRGSRASGSRWWSTCL